VIALSFSISFALEVCTLGTVFSLPSPYSHSSCSLPAADRITSSFSIGEFLPINQVTNPLALVFAFVYTLPTLFSTLHIQNLSDVYNECCPGTVINTNGQLFCSFGAQAVGTPPRVCPGLGTTKQVSDVAGVFSARNTPRMSKLGSITVSIIASIVQCSSRATNFLRSMIRHTFRFTKHRVSDFL